MKPLPDQRRWQIISGIFDQVIDLPRDQRTVLIEKLAGNDAHVVAEVFSLLQAHERSADFLETRADLSVPDLSEVLGVWENGRPEQISVKPPSAPDNVRSSKIHEETNRDQSASTDAGVSDAPASSTNIAADLKRIRPDYDILGFAGEGGSAIVFRALDRRLNREVAIKVLRANWAEKMGADYLDREARAASLVSDHIVRVYEVAPRDSQLPFLVMEWIDGPSLRNVVSQQQVLSPREAARIAREISTALAVAHSNGLAHGDVKPANVMLEGANTSRGDGSAGYGRAKVTDFGLADEVHVSAPRKRPRFAGTPAYASPEQLLENQYASPASDIWSLGATLYQMLVGTPPYSGAPHAIARQMQQGEPIRPRALDARIPRDLESICMKALSRNPQLRYASGAEMAEDLGRFLQGLTVQARPITLPLRAARAVRRRPVAWGLAILAVSSLIAGTLISNYFRLRAEQHLKTSQQHLATAEANAELAQQRLAAAMAAIDRFYVTVSENRLLNEPGLQELRVELLREALPHLKSLATTAPDLTKPQTEWARIVYRLALLENSVQGPDVALQTILQAVPVMEQMVTLYPDRDDLFEQWINTLMVAGIAYENKFDFANAEQTWQKIESLCMARQHPHQALMLGLLYLNWAKNHGTLGNFEKSLMLNATGIEFINQAADLEPSSAEAKKYAATLQGNRGLTLISLKQLDQALPHLRLATDYWKSRLEENAGDLVALSNILRHEVTLAYALAEERRSQDALKLVEEYLPQSESLATANPDWREVQDWHGQLLLAKSLALYHAGDLSEARESCDATVNFFAEAIAKPTDHRTRYYAALTYHSRACLLANFNDVEGVIRDFQKAKDLFVRWGQDTGSQAICQAFFQMAALFRASLLIENDRRAEGLKDLKEAIALSDVGAFAPMLRGLYQVARGDPGVPEDHSAELDSRVLQAAAQQWLPVKQALRVPPAMAILLAEVHAGASSSENANSDLLRDEAFRLIEIAVGDESPMREHCLNRVRSSRWLTQLHGDSRWKY